MKKYFLVFYLIFIILIQSCNTITDPQASQNFKQQFLYKEANSNLNIDGLIWSNDGKKLFFCTYCNSSDSNSNTIKSIDIITGNTKNIYYDSLGCFNLNILKNDNSLFFLKKMSQLTYCYKLLKIDLNTKLIDLVVDDTVGDYLLSSDGENIAFSYKLADYNYNYYLYNLNTKARTKLDFIPLKFSSDGKNIYYKSDGYDSTNNNWFSYSVLGGNITPMTNEQISEADSPNRLYFQKSDLNNSKNFMLRDRFTNVNILSWIINDDHPDIDTRAIYSSNNSEAMVNITLSKYSGAWNIHHSAYYYYFVDFNKNQIKSFNLDAISFQITVSTHFSCCFSPDNSMFAYIKGDKQIYLIDWKDLTFE